MPQVPNIYEDLREQALTLALRDGVVDPAEAHHIAAIEDAHNRTQAAIGVLKGMTGVPRQLLRLEPQPEWLTDLLDETGQKRKSA
jgi:hypothetical protein